MANKKTVVDSMTEQVYNIRPHQINAAGRLFGGALMSWIDELAAIVAMRHAQTHVTTAAIDNLNFKAGAYQGNMVVLRGRLTFVGSTSMEVQVETFTEALSGERKLINRAYLILVALDENQEPICVPKLTVETEEEIANWKAGEKRYALRKQRKIEGY